MSGGVSPERLRKLDPTMFGIVEEVFANVGGQKALEPEALSP